MTDSPDDVPEELAREVSEILHDARANLGNVIEDLRARYEEVMDDASAMFDHLVEHVREHAAEDCDMGPRCVGAAVQTAIDGFHPQQVKYLLWVALEQAASKDR